MLLDMAALADESVLRGIFASRRAHEAALERGAQHTLRRAREDALGDHFECVSVGAEMFSVLNGSVLRLRSSGILL